MKGQSLIRLFGVILTGIFVFAMVIGSIGFTQLDPLMTIQRTTQVNLLPTQTLFPTQIPDTKTPDAQIPDTDTPVPTETEVRPEPTDTDTPTPSSPLVAQCVYPDGWLPYTVKTGDTVYALALKADTSTRLLLQANCIGTTEDIQSGSTLYLPPIAFATPIPPVYVCGPPAHWRIVTVNPKETLYGLAVRYGTTIDALMKANCLNNFTLYAGQPLFVPPYIVVPPTPVWTPWPTLTPTPTATATPAISLTPTSTPSITLTPPTITPSVTVTATATLTPEPTFTPTPTPATPVTPTISPTPTPTPMELPSLTPTPTITPIPSLTPTQTITTTVN